MFACMCVGVWMTVYDCVSVDDCVCLWVDCSCLFVCV